MEHFPRPYETELNEMISRQLAGRGIADRRVLEAFRFVPRHEFVPARLSGEAYADYPLPIGEGQTISQPYMVALMTQLLRLKGNERVLEVGTGSGYQTAILAVLSSEVYSIERLEPLAQKAKNTLDRLGYKNIKIKAGDGTLGWEEHAPYDGIIVTAAAPDIPHSLVKQLKDSARMVIPIGGAFSQVLTVIEKKGLKIDASEIAGCVFVPLIGKEGWNK